MVEILALVTLLVAGACAPAGRHQASGEGSRIAADSGLILRRDEGERRLRRPRPGAAGRVAAAAMIIKVDHQYGGSPNFFMGYEEILPGDAIAAHMHPGYDEILFVHRAEGRAALGFRQAAVTEGTTDS